MLRSIGIGESVKPSTEFHGNHESVSRWLLTIQFWPLLKQTSFPEAAGGVAKIGFSLKLNTIGKFGLSKSVKYIVEIISLG